MKSYWFCIAIVICVALNESIQNCIPANVLPQYYYRFSRLPTLKKFIQCQNEVLSSEFYKKIQPLISNSQIQWLEINNTDSPEISAGAFNSLPITDLRINGAGVRIIRPGAFDGLTSLTKLSLKNNKISEVNDNYFSNLTNLQELDLSFNNIANITENTFNGLKSLNRLILQNNALANFVPDLFRNLTKLEILDLSFNKLEKIDEDLFRNVINLKDLSLNNNNLVSFDGSVLSGNKFLTNLYINSNNIRTISNLSFPNMFTNLNASHNIIQSLSFSKYTIVNTIDLSASGITSIKNFSFKNLAIAELYLDQNHLGLNPINSDIFSNLSSLEIISLKDNQIKKLDANLFKNNKNLRKLSIAKNYLSGTGLPILPVSLQDLDLNSNNLNSNLDITNLTSLKTFDISFNNLTEISLNFLKGLKWLFKLNFSHNKITKISLGSFRDLKMLREIDISFNHISTLDLGVFVGLDGLYRLDLSHNKITVLNDGVFHNLRLLQIINFSYNNITYSSVENTLSHLSILREIGLAGNGWSCALLTNILREFKRVKITNVGDYDVTNVDGVACNYETDTPKELIKLETNSFATINSKLTTNNILLILIFIFLVVKVILKHIPHFIQGNKLNNKSWRNKSEQELQLVDDS